MLLRTVRVARCTHCTWTTMHDSFLRRVTSDLYISGSSTGPAPECRPTLCGPAMRRNRRDATRRLWLDSRHRCTPMHLTTMLLSRSGPQRASPKEGNVPRVQCRRSFLRLPAKAIVLFRSQTSPFLFRVGFAVLPTCLLLFRSYLPESTGTNCGRGSFCCLLRSDSFPDCALYSRCAWLEPINFAMRRIPMIRDHRLMDSVYHWPILSNKTWSDRVELLAYFICVSFSRRSPYNV